MPNTVSPLALTVRRASILAAIVALVLAGLGLLMYPGARAASRAARRARPNWNAWLGRNRTRRLRRATWRG